MPKTILIVDDNYVDRRILKKTLSAEYDTLEAENGSDALDLMNRECAIISAVLLDIMMPEMDGYEVLRRMKQSSSLSQLPVIVISGIGEERTCVKALELGANNFVTKPYNPTIIKHHLHNIIMFKENAALVNALQRDRLTLLYNREAFFDRARQIIDAQKPGYYVMSSIDIDNFKAINDQYGTGIGDEVLRYVANCIRNYADAHSGICCRLSADNFCVLYPSEYMDSDSIRENHELSTKPPCLTRPVSIRIGRYIVDDITQPVDAMLYRALLAQRSIKGKWGQRMAQYDESLHKSLLYEQEIVADMGAALLDHQFEVWFQPQYNHANGSLIGAEALVRWRHPEKGLVLPSKFVSTFEKNGFIYELDKFVWEEACRCLRKWMDEGSTLLPVSVNISRYDVFQPDIVETLVDLVQKYDLPIEMLRLEITESAFSESTKQIEDVVNALIEAGFTVEIDDFGNGYSSLNTLKSIPAQIVKLDMRFLEDDNGSGRGGSIVESIVRMTKWLGMSVIAEGVESREQADYLVSVGCNYVQGYLYAQPMSTAEYEAHCRDAGEKGESFLRIETVANLDNNNFWDPKSMDTLVFSSYVGAACIFEYRDEHIELLRVNPKYVKLLENDSISLDYALKLDWARYLDKESSKSFHASLLKSMETGEEFTDEHVFCDIPGSLPFIYLRSTIRVIAVAGKRLLAYCMSQDITAQRQAESSERMAINQLRAVMDNVNCGITASVFLDNDNVRYLLINDKYYEMLGYTREQLHGDSVLSPVHPRDRKRVGDLAKRINVTGKPATIEFRAVRTDGHVIWLRCSISMTRFEGVAEKVQLAIFTDVTTEKMAAQELLDNLPHGAALYEYDCGKLSISHINKRFYEFLNRVAVDYLETPMSDLLHPDSVKVVIDELTSAISAGRDSACDVRMLCGNGEYRPFHSVGRIVPKGDGKYSVYVLFSPISKEAMSISDMLPVALSAAMEASSDISYVKGRDLRYICCSREFVRMLGLQSDKDIVGKNDYELFGAEFADKYAAEDREMIRTGRSIVDSIQLIPLKEGKERYTRASKYLLYDSDANVVGIYGTGHEVTEEREMKSQLELIANNIPGGIAVYECTPDTLGSIRLIYFSDGFCNLFGYTREEYAKLAAVTPVGLVSPNNLPDVLEHAKALIHDNKPMDCVYRAKINGGGFKWINIKGVINERRANKVIVNVVLFDVTALQEALERLRVSEKEGRLAIAHSKNVVCKYDVRARTLSIPPQADSIFELGDVVNEVPYGPIRDGTISRETADAYKAFYERILHGETDGVVAFQRKALSGWRWVEAHSSTIFGDDGKPVSAVISLADVTESFEKDAAYKKWRQSIQNREPKSYSLFHCNVSKNTFSDEEEGALLHLNFQDSSLSFDDRTFEYAEQHVYDEDKKQYRSFLKSEALLAGYYRGKRSYSFDFREKLPDGGVRWLRLSVDLIEAPHSPDVEGYLLIEDIDEVKRAELLTIDRAENDPLTGILNRATFAEKVNDILRNSKSRTQCALLLLDIDGFKMVNDVFGHGAGDQTLIDIADQLRSSIRREDLVGRLGGDEFVVFLNDLSSDDAAANKAKQVCEMTRKSFSPEVRISSSVGIAMTPRDGQDFESLYKCADATLYYVKGMGRDNYAFYHDGIDDDKFSSETKEPVVADSKKGRTRRILIVDDSPIDSMLLAGMFHDDYIVEKAHDGNTALVLLRHFGTAISVVLLDIMMPGMDGFAVLERMQQSPEMTDIPVIVVSSDEEHDTNLAAIRAGAIDYVTKPVEPELLRIRVESAISRAENERLRAKNSFLEFQNDEVSTYRTVLDRMSIVIVEFNRNDGSFEYSPIMSEYLAGTYDNRTLWNIFVADRVTDVETVETMRKLVKDVISNKRSMDGSAAVQLKAPSGDMRPFKMTVYKSGRKHEVYDKVIITFTSLDNEEGA